MFDSKLPDVYHSQAWRALRKQVLEEEPVCRCGKPSTDASHIVPHSRGGLPVRSNLRGLCHECNMDDARMESAKTKRGQAAARRADPQAVGGGRKFAPIS